MQDGRPRRLPFGITAVACAALMAVPVWGWDRIEDTSGLEGPTGLVVIVGLFVAAWAFVIAILHAVSPRPLAEGVLAGVLVAGVMAIVLVRIVASLDGSGNWPLVVIFGVPFYALAIGLGCASGLVAQRLRKRGMVRPSRPSPASLRRVGTACIVAGILLFVGTVAFFLPLFSKLLFLPVVMGGGLVAVGVWAFWDAGRRENASDAPTG